jgi:hypothetical protein
MKAWKMHRATPLLARGSININNWGGVPHIPKQMLSFVNIDTGQYSEVTDLDLKKQRRNKKLMLLKNRYNQAFKEKRITILLIVVPVVAYKTVKDFIDAMREKLSNRNYTLLGYYWQRDIGDIRFSLHFHFILVSTRISSEAIQSLLRGNNSSRAKFELCNSLNGIVNYLLKKEIYAAYNQKSWGSSIKFKLDVH